MRLRLPLLACRALLALGICAAATPPQATAQEAAAEESTRVYIVQLREAPAIVATDAARAAARGRFDARSGAVRRHLAELADQHDALLASVGASPDAKVYSYGLAFNGFAARLTPMQASQLTADPTVLRVWEDSVRKLRSNASGSFLGLLEEGTSLRKGLGLKGENIVIGVIDSGITPGHPSFADTVPGPRPRVCRSNFGRNTLFGRWLCKRFKKRIVQAYEPLQQWGGQCSTGERFSAGDCNHKLIGARYYVQGFRALYDMDENEFDSPRDADGHGTHIASVAAGNNVTATIGGREITSISGMAPRARIAVYKACWLQPGATRASCAMSDLQRAIEDAIADGVHIINYSIGTTTGGPEDPDAQALLAAADVGVLAVVAAGNGGPLAASIESPGSSPWVLTVAAASRSGTRFDESLRITAPTAAAGDIVFREAAFTPTLRRTGVVSGALAVADDGTPATQSDDASRYDACQALLDAAALAGRIVLVRRGGCTFQEKIERIAEAGARAVVVFNNDDGPLIFMSGTRGSVDIPAVLVGAGDGEALLDRLRDGESVELSLEKGRTVRRSDAGNVLARLSSRGANPDLPDVLKPDVVAPGVDILGAQTPDVANGVRGERFQYLTGTSMAVPHVAGVAALLMEAHPDWSPAMIRSALVTSARQNLRKDDGVSNADAFDAGGGYIVPNSAVEPGLVFDAGREDYDAFACGAGFARRDEAGCNALAAAGYATEPWELNLPSVSVGDLATHRTVHRWVTNVGAPATYQATVTAPPGIAVVVSPPTLTLGSGEGGQFTVTFSNQGLADRLDRWGFGAIIWNSTERSVRVPLAVRPVPLGVPGFVSASGTGGSTQFDVQFGYDGLHTVRAAGLAVPSAFSGYVTDDPLNFYTVQTDAALPDHIRRFRINVPEGTRYLRVGLIGVDAGAKDDLDLYLQCPDDLCPDGSDLLASAYSESPEIIDILDPAPGEYVIDVHGFATDETVGGPGANFEVGVWVIERDAGAGGFTASTPGTATVGTSTPVTLSWQGLEAGSTYLGLVTHGDGARILGETLVQITTP